MLCFRGIGIDFAGAVACMITLTPRLALAVDPAPVGPSFTLPSQEDKPPFRITRTNGWWGPFIRRTRPAVVLWRPHNFQCDLPKYHVLNAVVLGVSLDTVESHRTFCAKDSLTSNSQPTQVTSQSTLVACQCITSAQSTTLSARPSRFHRPERS